jgi:hypothetical protein
MRYWFDTEFVERGPDYPITLVSIGIVAEDGREYYAQSWYGISAAIHHEWVRENVVPHLTHMTLTVEAPAKKNRGPMLHLETCGHDDPVQHPDCPWRSLDMLAADLKAFCDPEQYGKPEFWAYYADYDWVVLCQVFGRMIDLPKGWPMFCLDIKQRAWALGSELDHLDQIVPQTDEHHALADARWNKAVSDHLDNVFGIGHQP